MTDYTKSTNFATKDSLPSGNPAKIVKGTEINTEFDNIATAVATKSNKASPTFTGTLTAVDVSITGNTTLGNDATDTVTITADVASNVIPSADSTYTLGDGSNYWSHGYIDAVTTTGNVAIGGNLTVTGNAIISGNLTFGDADTDSITLTADIASHITPDVDNTYDLGTATKEWRNLYVDGTAYVDAIDLNGTAITATAAELNYVSGVTSAIQTQLNAKQALDADLTAIAALANTDGNFIVGNGTTWVAESGATARASLGLTIGTDVQAYDADTAKYDDTTANFTGTLQNGGSNVVVDSDIGSTVQAYDATIVVDADIGSTVQAYDSNLTSFVGTFTLPTVDSTAGYVLKTDGAGTLSFVAQSAYDESSVAITGGTINGTTIGATTASTGNFSTLSIGGTAITSTAAELNILDGVTATAAELNYTDITTLGTTEASKVVTADANGVVTFDNGITEEYTAVTSTSNATTCNMQDGTNFSHTLTENTTFTFSNPASTGKVSAFTLKIVQDASASGYTVTWPASVDWPSATAPTLTATASAVDYFVFITHDGGTTWYGFTAGQALA